MKDFLKNESEDVILRLVSLLKIGTRANVFESYPNEVLLDCLELFICSNWTCHESLERISTLDKHISIGWRSQSGSVAFSSYEKAKMTVFAHIFCL